MEKLVTRAKFKVVETLKREDGNEVTLHPVTCGSPENESFFRWTPYGEIKIGTINEEASKQFEVGKEYYVDFTQAD